MMDLSFDWPHPQFDTPVGRISVRLHTFDNVFGIHPDAVDIVAAHDGVTHITASRLCWAGGEETAPGTVAITLTPIDGELDVAVSATHADPIRSIAVTLHDRPVGDIVSVREGRLSIPDGGRILRYPDGWFDLASPFFGIDADERLAIRSLDDRPRTKRIAFIPGFRDTSHMNVELHVEADAQHARASFTAPSWRLSTGLSLETVVERHRRHIETTYAVPSWRDRTDVPDWMHDISLVLGLHARHFTGYVFHTYTEMLERIQDVSSRIGAHRVLAYLPGWEGRYYRWYGRYNADPRLGGEDGYRRLIEGAHAIGARIMPMYGANIAARDLPGFERWGAPGILHTAGGFPAVGSVDWDASRNYDFAGGALINPAYAPWRAHLVEQISRNHDQFGFDATFLDISAMHGNDPAGDTTDGLHLLVDDLRAQMPDVMLSGEGWFDAIAGHIPLVQAGHRDYVPTLHDEPDPQLFTRTNRLFGHVSMGDPAFGSSGVHEAGWVDAWRLPVRHGIIPTLNLVRGSLQAAPERVERILDDARIYADRFAGQHEQSLIDRH